MTEESSLHELIGSPFDLLREMERRARNSVGKRAL